MVVVIGSMGVPGSGVRAFGIRSVGFCLYGLVEENLLRGSSLASIFLG